MLPAPWRDTKGAEPHEGPQVQKGKVMTEEEFRKGMVRDRTEVDPGEPLMQFFYAERAGYIPPSLAASIQSIFLYAAQGIVSELPRNPERTTALRKLLEARDWAMRAAVMK